MDNNVIVDIMYYTKFTKQWDDCIMATITKRTNKSGTYYYIVESARVNGKSRIVKQIYLGTAERIAKAVELMSAETQVSDPQFVTVYRNFQKKIAGKP